MACSSISMFQSQGILSPPLDEHFNNMSDDEDGHSSSGTSRANGVRCMPPVNPVADGNVPGAFISSITNDVDGNCIFNWVSREGNTDITEELVARVNPNDPNSYKNEVLDMGKIMNWRQTLGACANFKFHVKFNHNPKSTNYEGIRTIRGKHDRGQKVCYDCYAQSFTWTGNLNFGKVRKDYKSVA